MNLHLLGIGGTFMSGIALLAKALGHQVTGSDLKIYPPTSTQLKKASISIEEGYEQFELLKTVDLVIVGNVIKRGNPIIEYILNEGIPFISGPAWLYQNVLKNYQVLAIAGTHGKTTTASLLTWILEDAGLNPSFLIGGIPDNFGISARLNDSDYFVIEADEYDTAFFDKRAKFIHYLPRMLILNNLEFDHADIFSNLAAIQKQFQFLIRTIPSKGLIVCNSQDKHLKTVLEKECYTPIKYFGDARLGIYAELLDDSGSQFKVFDQQKELGVVKWHLIGSHNVENALASISVSHQLNIPYQQIFKSLSSFKNVKRRLEIKANVHDIIIYDDFAHHPTAIAKTLNGLRAKVGKKSRIIAVLEFGSYTMREGFHQHDFNEALVEADRVIFKKPKKWELTLSKEKMLAGFDDVDEIVHHLTKELKSGDHVIIMSNAGFENIHQKLLTALQLR